MDLRDLLVPDVNDITEPACMEKLLMYLEERRMEDDEFMAILIQQLGDMTIDWPQPWYQECPTSITRPFKMIKGKEPFRTDSFSKAEDEILDKNWRKLVKKYNIPDKPKCFATWKNRISSYHNINVPEERARQFVTAFLAQGLERNLSQVYRHIVTYYGAPNKGDYSEVELKIMEICFYHCPDKAVVYLADILSRESRGIRKRLMESRGDNGKRERKKLTWSLETASTLVNALMKHTGLPLKKLKGKQFPKEIWLEIEKEMDQYYDYLHRFWYTYLHVQLFARCEVKLKRLRRKILKIIMGYPYLVWSDIRWKQIATHFPDGFTHRFLYKMIYLFIKKKSFPNFLQAPLKEVICHLMDKLKSCPNKRLKTLALDENSMLQVVRPMKMKTMFISHDGGNNCARKTFQKPNILRRKTIGPTVKAKVPQSLHTTQLTAKQEQQKKINTGCAENVDTALTSSKTTITKSKQKFPVHRDRDVNSIVLFENKSTINTASTEPHLVCTDQKKNNALSDVVNVESFLNDSTLMQSTLKEHGILSINLKRDWCIDFINEAQQIIIEDQDGSHLASLHAADESATECMSVSVVEPEASPAPDQPTVDEAAPVNIVVTPDIEHTFECAVPGCNKTFKSKDRLSRHKRTHCTDPPKQPRPVTVECPAKRRGGEDMELCGRMFLFREDLAKHMKEEHTPDDAMYICTVCGRRFFWCVGLKAHGRAHSAPAGRALLCGWPGCGRAFPQPCRLREHQRKHTGDRPYVCSYPNCTWSFRTASKLMRHARRHTGERRHACALCGHAFPRREHLRNHTATHHRRKHHCTHPGCQRRFVSVDALGRHIMTRHMRDRTEETVTATTRSVPWRNVFPQAMDSGDPVIESTASKSTTTCTTTNQTPKVAVKKRLARSKVKAKARTTQTATDVTQWQSVDTTDVEEVANEEVTNTLEPESEPSWYLHESENAQEGIEQTEWHVYSASEPADEAEDWNASAAEVTDARDGNEWRAVGIDGDDNAEDGDDSEWQTTRAVAEADGDDSEWQATHAVAEADGDDSEWQATRAVAEVDADGSEDWHAVPTDADGDEWHAARTHCTWPLAPRPPDSFDLDEEPYTLEEDVQVELSEGSETNAYTIRSDLFLHGNLLTNDDSEHIPGVSAAGDSGLSLLDAHPTVGLLQEDLMYTDAAVDESSFRVLLLNGEELV